jgi:magnesium chelatase family protein
VALFRTRTAAVFGIDAHIIVVEVGTASDFITIGMSDTANRPLLHIRWRVACGRVL